MQSKLSISSHQTLTIQIPVDPVQLSCKKAYPRDLQKKSVPNLKIYIQQVILKSLRSVSTSLQPALNLCGHITSYTFHINKMVFHSLRVCSFFSWASQQKLWYNVVSKSNSLAQQKKAVIIINQFTTIFNSHVECIIKTSKNYLPVFTIIKCKEAGFVITKFTGLVLLQIRKQLQV